TVVGLGAGAAGYFAGAWAGGALYDAFEGQENRDTDAALDALKGGTSGETYVAAE
ncbi:MAG: hypothetical protein RIR70_926, partial [Pseudomonadota bacterium]